MDGLNEVHEKLSASMTDHNIGDVMSIISERLKKLNHAGKGYSIEVNKNDSNADTNEYICIKIILT